MKSLDWKKFTPHIAALAIFWVLTSIFFLPLFNGKELRQSDIRQWEGAAKEIMDHRASTGEEALWTNSMFSGMPAFQISVDYKANLTRYVDKAIRFLIPPTADMMLLQMICFYFLMMVLGIDYRLGIAGALAFAYGSYNLDIIEAGHNTKALAIAYFFVVLAGVILAYRSKWLAGAVVTGIGLSLQIYSNHLQITYYLLFTILILGLCYLIDAFRTKTLPHFFKASAVLVIAASLGVMANITNIMMTSEYGKASTRSQSELSEKKSSSGLDKDYSQSWSYGVSESFTLLIPGAFGGASGAGVSKNSASYNALMENRIPAGQANDVIKNLPMYWGDQPFTSASVYLGAIMCFLFVLGIFVMKSGPLKWWLISSTVVSLLFAWGRHFPMVSDVLFDYLPGFNKFRTVSMGLIIAGACVPIMAILTVWEIINEKKDSKILTKKLFYSVYVVGGLCLIFALIPGAFFDFTASGDEALTKQGFPDWLVSAIQMDRESLMRTDSFRSLVFVLLGASTIWLFIRQKLSKEYLVLALGFFILMDEWLIAKRYLNEEDFTKKRAKIEMVPSAADRQILEDKDPNYRVMNTTVSTFNDASTSYFHKSIGGYHGAKLKRYQELVEYHISKNNIQVLNMLNTRYFIIKDEESGAAVVRKNPYALGNAWFVSKQNIVPNADAELAALTDFDPLSTVVIDKRYEDQLSGMKLDFDSAGRIALSKYAPNHLTYTSKAKSEQLAVFSEIYYEKGWNAYVDGKPSSYFRTNYVLRGMRVPAGEHTIEFKFEPEKYFLGENISMASSVILLGLFGWMIFAGIRKSENE